MGNPVDVMTGDGSAPPTNADGTAGGDDAAAAGQGDNKGCQVGTKPNDKNREKVNEKKADNSPATCSMCLKTGEERRLLHVAKWEGEFYKAYAKGDQKGMDEFDRKAKIHQNPANNKLTADHIYPASAIKADPKFKQLEAVDPKAAKQVMTAQGNMEAVCSSCNPSKGAKVDPNNPKQMAAKKLVDDMINDALKKALG